MSMWCKKLLTYLPLPICRGDSIKSASKLVKKSHQVAVVSLVGLFWCVQLTFHSVQH